MTANTSATWQRIVRTTEQLTSEATKQEPYKKAQLLKNIEEFSVEKNQERGRDWVERDNE